MGIFVLTGAAGGIGHAIRAGLERDGHVVVGVDLHDSEIRADLGDERQIVSVVAEVAQRAPQGVDGLVTCAGVGPASGTRDLIPKVNFFGTVDLVEGLMPALEVRGGAAVLVSSSSATLMSYDEGYVQALLDGDRGKVCDFAATATAFHLYGGAKLALVRWMRRRSATAARAGVRLNALAPGHTETRMTAAGLEDPELGAQIQAFAESIPVGRSARPEDQAHAACFLLSERAAQIAGAVLFVDGGHDAMSRPDRF